MGVVFGALLVSGLLSLVIGAMAWFVFLRRLRSPITKRLSLLAIVAISGLGLLFPVLSFLWSKTVSQGSNVPAGQYHAVSPRLPSVVTHVTYYSNYAGTEALFEIQEKDLVDWAKSNNWNIKEIEHPEPVEFPDLNISTSVAKGVIYKTFDPRGTGVMIVYNRETNECFFRYSSY